MSCPRGSACALPWSAAGLLLLPCSLPHPGEAILQVALPSARPVWTAREELSTSGQRAPSRSSFDVSSGRGLFTVSRPLVAGWVLWRGPGAQRRVGWAWGGLGWGRGAAAVRRWERLVSGRAQAQGGNS